MASDRQAKLEEALDYLKKAVAVYDKNKKNHLNFLALSKAFEVCVEYAWKELKFRVEDEGLSAPSPKEAVRQAAKLGFIEDPEAWIDCINARNDSVHDYFGIPEADYRDLAKRFLQLAKPLAVK